MLVEAIYTTGQDLADPDKVTLSRRLDVDLRALRNEFTNEAYEVDWAVEQSGDYIVAGDGPWFISVEETWADATINSRMSGTASYVILDDEGALRIAEHYWAGIRGWEGLDE